MGDDYNVHLWAYALGTGEGVQRMTSRRARCLLSPEEEEIDVPERLRGDEDHLTVATALVVRIDGRPSYVERAHILRLTPGGKEIPRSEAIAWERLLGVGEAVAVRARAPEGHAGFWVGLFRDDPRPSPLRMAEETGVSMHEVLFHLAALIEEDPASCTLFDLHEGIWRKGEETLRPPKPGLIPEKMLLG